MRYLIGLVFLVTSLQPAWSAPTNYRFSNLNGKRQITFYSKAPMENFEGTVHELSGLVSVDFSRRNLGLKGTISLPVSSMKTGITGRDVHMRNANWLNENRYPTIKFELDEPQYQKVKKKGRNKWFVEARGRFTLKGRTKPIDVPITITRKTNKKGEFIYIKGGFVVNLKDYGVKGPLAMKMIGAKVSPDIKVSLKLVGKAMKGKGY